MSQLFQHITFSRLEISQGQIQPYNSQLMVGRQERVQCWVWGEEESLWRGKEVKYLGVLFMSAEKVEREIDRLVHSLHWCGSHTGLMWFTHASARRQSPGLTSQSMFTCSDQEKGIL